MHTLTMHASMNVLIGWTYISTRIVCKAESVLHCIWVRGNSFSFGYISVLALSMLIDSFAVRVNSHSRSILTTWVIPSGPEGDDDGSAINLIHSSHLSAFFVVMSVVDAVTINSLVLYTWRQETRTSAFNSGCQVVGKKNILEGILIKLLALYIT